MSRILAAIAGVALTALGFALGLIIGSFLEEELDRQLREITWTK